MDEMVSQMPIYKCQWIELLRMCHGNMPSWKREISIYRTKEKKNLCVREKSV